MDPRDHKVDRLEVKIVVEQLLSGEAKGVRGALHALLTPTSIRKRVALLEKALAPVIEEHLGAVTEGDLARHSEYREGLAFTRDDLVIDRPLRNARGELADLGWACDDFDYSVAQARSGGWSAREARELAQEDCALAAALDRAHDALLAVCIGLSAATNDDPDPTDGGGGGSEQRSDERARPLAALAMS